MIETLENLKFSKKNGGKPLYEQIRTKLQESIRAADLPQGYQLPNISRLARKWNVHYRTVRTALEILERDGFISCAPNRRAVVTLNPLNKTTVRQKVAMAHIRMHDDAFVLSLAEGVAQFASEHDVECTLLDAGNSHKRFLQAIAQPGSGINGLLFMPHELPEYKRAVEAAVRSGSAIVFMDRTIPGMDISCVSSDHVGGAYLATKHLFKQHGRPVYHIGSVTQPSSCRDWVRGWSTAMREYGFSDTHKYCFKLAEPEAKQVLHSEEWVAGAGIRDAHKFFDSSDEDVFCIFAGNDYVAKILCETATERGLVVGKNLFVVGFCNLPLAERMPVPLTSVDEKPVVVGYTAAKVLYESIIRLQVHPVHRLIPTKLCVRQSSVKPNPGHASFVCDEAR